MGDQTILCPHCQAEIALTETLSLHIRQELQGEFDKKQKEQSSLLAKKEEELRRDQAAMQQEKQLLEKSIEEKVKVEKEKMWVLAQEKAKEKINVEFEDLKKQNEEREIRFREVERNELALRARARELEEQKRNQELDLHRKIDEERKRITEEAQRMAREQVDERMRIEQEENRRKEQEKDKQIEMMRRSLDEANRKAAQSSMQIQGEVQENDLKLLLANNFHIDTIEDVPTGVNGADLIQTVNTAFGQSCGIVLWESKNTKTWSGEWIKKLKGDQGIAKADISVLVTKVLPEGMVNFGSIDGIWVVNYASVIPLTHMIRHHLMQIHQVKNSLVGRDEKMEYLYQYMSSAQFRNRVENIVMAFSGLKQDLETEKRSMQRIWAKREKEIERVIMNTSGMYGDVQGIIGASLQPVDVLELSIPEEEHNDTLL